MFAAVDNQLNEKIFKRLIT